MTEFTELTPRDTLTAQLVGGFLPLHLEDEAEFLLKAGAVVHRAGLVADLILNRTAPTVTVLKAPGKPERDLTPFHEAGALIRSMIAAGHDYADLADHVEITVGWNRKKLSASTLKKIASGTTNNGTPPVSAQACLQILEQLKDAEL